ncbi:MAG: hypothetical protein ACIAQ0_13545 [Phycisphaerales bacterium JB058]
MVSDDKVENPAELPDDLPLHYYNQRPRKDWDFGLTKPMKDLGHPLGVLAVAWLLINALFWGGAFGGIFFLWIYDNFVHQFVPSRSTWDFEVFFAMAGVTVGIVCGYFAFYWLYMRMGRKGVSVVLLTIGFIPVVGLVVHALQAIAETWLIFRKKHS